MFGSGARGEAQLVRAVPDANPIKPLLEAIENLAAFATTYRYPSPVGKIKVMPPAPDVAKYIAGGNAGADTITRTSVVFRATGATLAALRGMTNRISLVLGSLVGAVAIHATLVACTAGSGVAGVSGISGVPGTEGVAHADGTPTASAPCAQWEIKTVTPSTFGWTSVSYTDANGKAASTSMPNVDVMVLEAGWEPIGALYYSPLVRHCVK